MEISVKDGNSPPLTEVVELPFAWFRENVSTIHGPSASPLAICRYVVQNMQPHNYHLGMIMYPFYSQFMLFRELFDIEFTTFEGEIHFWFIETTPQLWNQNMFSKCFPKLSQVFTLSLHFPRCFHPFPHISAICSLHLPTCSIMFNS